MNVHAHLHNLNRLYQSSVPRRTEYNWIEWRIAAQLYRQSHSNAAGGPFPTDHTANAFASISLASWVVAAWCLRWLMSFAFPHSNILTGDDANASLISNRFFSTSLSSCQTVHIRVRWPNHLELPFNLTDSNLSFSLDLQTPTEIFPLLLLLAHSARLRFVTKSALYKSTVIIFWPSVNMILKITDNTKWIRSISWCSQRQVNCREAIWHWNVARAPSIFETESSFLDISIIIIIIIINNVFARVCLCVLFVNIGKLWRRIFNFSLQVHPQNI